MPVICLSSPKGGVGKTSLTANLAHALRRAGERVIALDLDVQNSLRLHFALPATAPGLAQLPPTGSWAGHLNRTGSGVSVLPFGSVTNNENYRIERYLAANPAWLRSHVAELAADGSFVLIDTAPGPSLYLDGVSPVLDLQLVVLLSDPTSVSLLPRVESGTFSAPSSGTGRASGALAFLINQVDPRLRLNRDIAAVMQAHLGPRLLGTVHRDENIAEAIANQRLAADYAPASRAVADLAEIASRLRAGFARTGMQHQYREAMQ